MANIDEFERVYTDHYLNVFLYVYKKINHQQDAEDLTNEIFLSCYKKYEEFDPTKASIKTWLFVIASNRLKNYYRDRKVNKSIDDEDNQVIVSSDDDITKAMYLEEVNRIINEAITCLPERQQKIVKMKYFDKKTGKEIADELELTEVNERVLLKRALEKIKIYLEENNYSYVKGLL